MVSACSKPAQTIEITLTQNEDGAWRLGYELARPVARLDLGPSLNGFRASDWRLEAADLAIVGENGRDVLVSNDKKKKFHAAMFKIDPHRNDFAKQYEPIAVFGDGGAIVYTGHFWPYGDDRERLRAIFKIAPRSGARLVAFGEEREQASDLARLSDHPAFVYVGALEVVDFGAAAGIVDASAPDWVREALKRQTPHLLDELAKALGRGLGAPPDLFVLIDGDDAPGRLRYNGDTLPGQVVIRLSGGAWSEPTPEARLILLTATAHEAAHLWQMRARPRDENAPAWIHEGGADALAAEVLTRLGLTDQREIAAVAEDCKTALAGRSLAEAEAAGVWPASYSCGRVLAEIAAHAAAGGDVAAFWREFIARAEAAGGYDEALFYSMIEEGAGRDLAASVRRFARSAFAAPDKELARLLDEAGR